MIGIPTKLILYGVLLAAGGGIVWGLIQYGRNLEATERQAVESQAIISAMQAAREKERRQQQEITNAVKHQNTELMGVRDRLAANLERLRNRAADRANMPGDPAADGQSGDRRGCTTEDREVVFRIGADHDRYRAGLKACYAAYDAIREQ